MIRRSFCALTLAFLMLATAFGESYLEKAKKIDPVKNTVTIVVEGKEKTFKVDSKAQFLMATKAGKKIKNVAMKDGLKGVKNGDEVNLTTELKDGEEVITRLILGLSEKKK